MQKATKYYKTALTIAGSDSGGGAGIQADLKTMSACGVYATSAITALTAQNTLGVQDVFPIPSAHLRAQIRAVLDDIGADAIKIGMLHNREVIQTVAEALADYPIHKIVLDPVMVATSGDTLLQNDAIIHLKNILIPRVSVITPNIPEAEILLAHPIHEENMTESARALATQFKVSVLLKGGHLKGAQLQDVLYHWPEKRLYHYQSKRLQTPNTHGTGCTLSSAIAAYLAQEMPLPQAIEAARTYLQASLTAGAAYKLGAGHGPVHHFSRFW